MILKLEKELYVYDKDGQVYRCEVCKECTCIKYKKVSKQINDTMSRIEQYRFSNGRYSSSCHCDEENSFYKKVIIEPNTKNKQIIWFNTRIIKLRKNCGKCKSNTTHLIKENRKIEVLKLKCSNCYRTIQILKAKV